MDAHTRAYVVLGPKNRAHLFTSAGKHMTSMQLDPGELDRKVGRRRWRPVSPETAGALKERIILLADGDEAGVST